MQKRTLYLSLLLVSCLLFFGFSYASAQSVTFQSKSVTRCSDVVLNITVDSPEELSAFEIVFEISGDFDGTPTVEFASGFTGLTNRFGPDFDGTYYRMAAMKADAGDVCVDANGGIVVGEISLHTADVCSGTVTVTGATVTGGCCDGVSASTGLVSCDLVGLATTIVDGVVTITNQTPTIACPGDITVHWGDVVEFDVTFDDADLTHGCEELDFTVSDGPGAIDGDGHYTWATGGDDVCGDSVTVRVTDKCGAYAECSLDICVYNDPPEIDHDPADTLFAVWGITLSGQVDADDPDGGPNALTYQLVSFDGETSYGSGFNLNTATGEWTWDIGDNSDYLGDFTLCLKVSDGANVCDPCSPSNSDEACYAIHVSGFAISIEKVHDQIQGQNTTVGIYLDSTYMPDFFSADMIGGFDFLIAYDASALNAISAEPGALIDNDDFEYFTYRFGANGNCGSGCPSGLLRVVGMRETNDGVLNEYHIKGPGELVKLHFYVSNDYNFEGSYAPIKFYWLDCGDNTLSDESGNWLYLGRHVFDFEYIEITDPDEYGYSGPADSCFDTVYTSEEVFKNAPLGAIIFRNGGIDIIPVDEIDDRGDVNLNGVPYEIADAVVFTNYFIEGANAFTINYDGQKAATEINGDGIALTVADLVYLTRVIVGDALPLPKVNPAAFADFRMQGDIVSVQTNTDIGGALFVFNGQITPSLAPDAAHMDLVYGYDNNTTRVLIIGQNSGDAVTSGEVLYVNGDGTLISVEAAEYSGTVLKTTNAVIPTEFVLSQNYPNPFNPTTAIKLDLPVATDYMLAIYNVNGQKVAEFSGHSDAGTVIFNWDATGLASGLYFYKVDAGSFKATKKMVFLK